MDAELIAALRPVRLPATTEALVLADALAAFAIGLGAALIVLLALRLVTRRRETLRHRIAAELTAARELTAPERLFVQARLLERIGAWSDLRNAQNAGRPAKAPTRDGASDDAGLRQALYRPVPAIDLDALDETILRLAGRTRS